MRMVSLIVKGRKLTGFTDAEDAELDLRRHRLFLLEQPMNQNGAKFVTADVNWNAKAVEELAQMEDQNPSSAAQLSQLLG